ncbi:FAD-binding protein [Candidatus Daviesbacteria bacterium]|nr:FAD-binding protein [Candidatus Daviesbacteria bacterium]
MKSIINKSFDVIVIGSGMAGCHAAYPLVKKGLKVGMIDAGDFRESFNEDWLNWDFEQIRRKIRQQHQLFLGQNLDNLKFDVFHGSYSKTRTHGSRAFVTEWAEKFLPIKTNSLRVIQSLARGGFGNVWTGACDILDSQELLALGLPSNQMRTHYQIVIDRIGVSGRKPGYKLQPPVNLDLLSKKLLKKYQTKKSDFEKLGISLSKTLLALLTKEKSGRKPTSYRDMDFWDDFDGTMYRPEFTLKELEQEGNFSYISHKLVIRLAIDSKGVRVFCMDLPKLNKEYVFRSKYIIVAAGALNTTKILLKSFNLYDKSVPFLSKTHWLTAFIKPNAISLKPESKRISLSQLTLIDQLSYQGFKQSYSQLVTYKSLLTYPMARYIPLPLPEAMTLFSLISPGLIIIDTRFPELPSDKKYSRLKKAKNKRGDFMEISYQNSEEELKHWHASTQRVKKAMGNLGLIALKTLYPPSGDASHYAGGVPIVSSNEKTNYPLYTNSNGQLNLSERVYVADGALWKALPAKPPGLTLMANANRIGTNIANLLR